MPLSQRTSSTAVPVKFWAVILTALLMSCCSNLQADIVQYTFTGEIPVGATDTHSEIAIGETWVASFVVDTSTPDTGGGELGEYIDAVIAGTLEFSGGYTSQFEFASYDVGVFNDNSDAVPGFVTDIILIHSELGQPSQQNFIQFFTTDLSTLTSIAMPGPGASGSPVMPTLPSGLSQLSYSDSNGEIEYHLFDANNVEFSVSATFTFGDANGDGVLTNVDIAPFVLALTNPVAYQAMYPAVDPDIVLDMNGDGGFDNLDIAGFVAALTGGGKM